MASSPALGSSISRMLGSRARARQPGPLQHAARQLRRHLLAFVLQLHLLELFLHNRPDFVIALLGVAAQRKGHIFAHGNRIEKRGVLKKEPDLPAHFRQPLAVAMMNLLALDQDFPFIGLNQPHHHLQRHALAHSAASQQAKGLSGSDLQRYIFQHFLIPERLGHMFEFDSGPLPVHRRFNSVRVPHPGNQIMMVLTRMASAKITRREENTTLRVEARPTPAAPCDAV